MNIQNKWTENYIKFKKFSNPYSKISLNIIDINKYIDTTDHKVRLQLRVHFFFWQNGQLNHQIFESLQNAESVFN